VLPLKHPLGGDKPTAGQRLVKPDVPVRSLTTLPSFAEEEASERTESRGDIIATGKQEWDPRSGTRSVLEAAGTTGTAPEGATFISCVSEVWCDYDGVQVRMEFPAVRQGNLLHPEYPSARLKGARRIIAAQEGTRCALADERARTALERYGETAPKHLSARLERPHDLRCSDAVIARH